jgi:hypothetical protein
LPPTLGLQQSVSQQHKKNSDRLTSNENGSLNVIQATVNELVKQNQDLQRRIDENEQDQECEDEGEDEVEESQALAQEL